VPFQLPGIMQKSWNGGDGLRLGKDI
jgi:hypothetical protein